MRIISTTDGKNIGEIVDENQKTIQFEGYLMEVLGKKYVGDQIILFNFNYVIIGIKETS